MGTQRERRRFEFAAGVFAAVFRIWNRPPMAIGIAKIHSGLRRMIELIGRLIVPEPISAIVREPQLVALRVPIESHRVPNSTGHNLVAGSIGIDARDQGIAVRIRLTDVAWRPD